MNQELIDVVDSQNKLTGESVGRDKIHIGGLWHRAVHIWMYSSDGKVLLQLRSARKKESADLWDISVAGHVTSGDTPEDTIPKEIKEELGIDFDEQNLVTVGILRDSRNVKGMEANHNQYLYIYLYKLDQSTEFSFQDGEVQDTAWMTISEFESELSEPATKAKFVSHQDHYYGLIISSLKDAVVEQ